MLCVAQYPVFRPGLPAECQQAAAQVCDSRIRLRDKPLHQVPRQRGRRPARAYGDLDVADPPDSRDDEIAQLRVVDNVAQPPAATAVVADLAVDLSVVRAGDDDPAARGQIPQVRPLPPEHPSGQGRIAQHRPDVLADPLADHVDHRPRLQQRFDLPGGYLPPADHAGRLAPEVHADNVRQPLRRACWRGIGWLASTTHACDSRP